MARGQSLARQQLHLLPRPRHPDDGRHRQLRLGAGVQPQPHRRSTRLRRNAGPRAELPVEDLDQRSPRPARDTATTSNCTSNTSPTSPNTAAPRSRRSTRRPTSRSTVRTFGPRSRATSTRSRTPQPNPSSRSTRACWAPPTSSPPTRRCGCSSRSASTSVSGARFTPDGRTDRPVVIANSRGPESLTSVVDSLGAGVTAGTTRDDARCSIVALAVPWNSIHDALAELSWSSQIVIDATNAVLFPQPRAPPRAVGMTARQHPAKSTATTRAAWPEAARVRTFATPIRCWPG